MRALEPPSGSAIHAPYSNPRWMWMGSGAMYAKYREPPPDRHLVTDQPPPAADPLDGIGHGPPHDCAQGLGVAWISSG